MRAPGFWYQPAGLWAQLLCPLGFLYGRITAHRMGKSGLRLPVPVICIGNLVAGGAGKTPTTIALVQALQMRGFNPAVLSRGYGGNIKAATKVEAHHTAQDVGDEPLLLAKYCPVFIARDRREAAALALRATPQENARQETSTPETSFDLFILDDGLQNPHLIKDFTLAVVDGGSGFGNGQTIPAGPLRAPIYAQIPFIDAFLIIGDAQKALLQAVSTMQRPLYQNAFEISPSTRAQFVGKNCLAYAGIGRPEKFFTSLKEAGAHIIETSIYPDHHAFTRADQTELLARARAKNLSLVCTTKDMARLMGRADLTALADASDVLPVTLTLPPALIEQISASLAQKGR